MQVFVDSGKCIGCGMCAATAPAVFRLENGVSTVLCQPEPQWRTRVFDVAGGCPVNAISLTR